MPTVRKIVVSKIAGGFSSSSNILPKGELILYEDGDGKFDLVLHDGVNTTNLNKILSRGIFYGDSSENLPFKIIKLIPDIQLQQNGDQYLIIDPTAPNHIHIRSGGNMDDSSADLFLGGEKNYVKVSDLDNTVILSVDDENGGTKSWMLDNSGNINFPDGSQQNVAWSGGKVVSPPATSVGISEDKEGSLAFSNTHIYYCTADYDGTSNVWKRIAWSGDTW